MIDEAMLPHLVDVLTAGTRTDRYGNEIEDWTTPARQSARAWMQQQTRAEETDQRNAQIGEWTLICNPVDADGDPLTITGASRVEWSGTTFEVAGPPGPAWSPAALHHYEIRLRTVEG
ncbi:hypothetical protein [Streptomyces chumphonensis]|uniref:hypothetical protein n=1 Tax=Streptomyces chumphonensis TaxID=1214925 RepID=UPI003D7161FC